MEFNINQQVVVIGNSGDPISSEVITVLHHRKDFCIRTIEAQDDLSIISQNNFKGFIIISLPSGRLKDWAEQFLKNNLRNYFSVYYYDSFFAERLGHSIYLEFDFVIAGEQRKINLSNLLDYLRENYWRKIPYSLLKVENGSMTNVMRRILFSLENQNSEDLTLEKISTKLRVRKSLIRKEIKSITDLNFSDLKKLIFDYYQENYPQYYRAK